jgi:hypothetical protein
MKQLFTLLLLVLVNVGNTQGKFFGGNGDGFATATISNIVLPSTGIILTGASCGEDICLDWNTIQEANTSHFNVERMNSISAFQMVGRVEAAGMSNTGRDYSFTDKWSLDGLNYYRLAQTDKDGRINYSSTIQAKEINRAGDESCRQPTFYPAFTSYDAIHSLYF